MTFAKKFMIALFLLNFQLTFAAEFEKPVLKTQIVEQDLSATVFEANASGFVKTPFEFAILQDNSLWVRPLLPDSAALTRLGPYTIDRTGSFNIELGGYVPQDLLLFEGHVYVVATQDFDRSSSPEQFLLELTPTLGSLPTAAQHFGAHVCALTAGLVVYRRTIEELASGCGVSLAVEPKVISRKNGERLRLADVTKDHAGKVVDVVLKSQDGERLFRLFDINRQTIRPSCEEDLGIPVSAPALLNLVKARSQQGKK